MTDFPRHELAPGYSVSRIINGCWQLSPDHGGGPATEAEVFRSFAERVDHGFTTFDCADIYTGVEELIGRFRRTLADPDSIEIHTKYVPDRRSLGALSDDDVDAAIERSLKRLGVERLDLLQVHWWDYDEPGLDRLVDRLLHLQANGKIRLLGATNFDTLHVRKLHGMGAKLVTLQAQYSLIDRRPEQRMLGLAESSGMWLLPYGVLAGGFLGERWLRAEPPSDMNRSLAKYRLIVDEIGGWPALQRLLRVLERIAKKHATTIDAVAARCILDRPRVAAVMLGIGSRSRAAQNAGIASLALDEEDRAAIDALLAQQAIPPGDMYALERDPAGPHAAIIKTDLNAGEGVEPVA